MSRRYGRSYFNELATRLSRLLSLDGEIPIELGDRITPVVMVGDGLAPGMTGNRGRRFVCTWSGNGAGAGFVTWRASRELVITALFPQNSTSTLQLYQVDATTMAAAGLTFGPSGTFVERVASSSDYPPLELATANTDPGAGKVALTRAQSVTVAGQPNASQNWPAPIMLPAGAGITIYAGAVGSHGWILGYDW